MKPFLPEQVNETAQLKNMFDDDLDVSAFRKQALSVPRGDTLVWDHVYQNGLPGYQIHSKDLADLELLKLYGEGNGAHLETELTLFFEDGHFNEYRWSTHWQGEDHVVASGNDLLGALQGRTIVWFRVSVTPRDGAEQISVDRIDFFWEVGNIEEASCGLHDIIDIEGIGEVYAKKLRNVGINTVQQLLHLGKTLENRTSIASLTGLPAKRIERWVEMSELWRIRGVGEEYSELLEVTGVDSLPKLAERDPKQLHKDLKATNEKRKLVRSLPNELDVKRWVIQAKNLGPLVAY